MDVKRFWQLVAAAREEAGADVDARVESLRQVLAEESPEELQSFQKHYDEMISRSYHWDLWAAAYMINGGCSDDGFRYFRDWLISEGEPVFERAVESAESLADVTVTNFAENELYGYVALGLFERITGGELERDFSTDFSMPAGDEWQEEDLGRRFPLLGKKYGFAD